MVNTHDCSNGEPLSDPVSVERVEQNGRRSAADESRVCVSFLMKPMKVTVVGETPKLLLLWEQLGAVV